MHNALITSSCKLRDFHLLIFTISYLELPDFLFFFFSFFFGQRFMNWGTVLNTQDLRPALETVVQVVILCQSCRL